MRKLCSLWLSLCLIIGLFAVIPASASAETLYPVPRVTIITDNGNGTTLEKADGYVNAAISITDVNGETLSDSVQLKVRETAQPFPL